MNVHRGFTLLEILLALSLLALVIGISVETSVGNIAQYQWTYDSMLARWVAQNQLASLQLTTQSPATGQTTGTTEMGGRTWYWVQQTERLPQKALLRVSVNVYAHADKKEVFAQQITYVTTQQVMP